jgi:hypothetical protein
MKTLKIEIPEDHEIDQEQSNLAEGKIVFKQSKKALPKSWEELKRIQGYYITSDCKINVSSALPANHVKNTFTTKIQAEASIALAQLSQLRDVYRQGWTPDYNNNSWDKYSITCHSVNLQIDNYNTNLYFLTFQTQQIAQEFLNNFRDLIEQARPLIS